MQQFIDIIKSEMPEVDKIEIAEYPIKAIKLSWKTNDDESRLSKRVHPIVIKSFDGIDFSSNVGDEICIKFTAFIRNKRANFKPRTTKNTQESHTPEYWIFPPED